MLYAPREVFVSGQVADADQLMRELNRAERAITTLDQNNVDDAQVTPAMTIASDASMEGVSLTHDSSNTLLRVDGSGTFTFPSTTENAGWITVEDGAGAALELEFTTIYTSRVHILGSFHFTAGAAGSPTDWRWTARLYINGEMGSQPTTVSVDDGTSPYKTNVLVREWVVLPPGTHMVRMKLRDWRDTVSGSTAITAASQWIGAIGWTR